KQPSGATTSQLPGGINLSNGTLDSSNSSGKAGNVTIIAPNAITLNNINMNGISGVPVLSVTTAQPKGSITADVNGKVSGALTPGTLTGGTITVLSGAIVNLTAINNTTAGGTVNLTTASTAGTITVDGSIQAGGAAPAIFGAAGGNGGVLNIKGFNIGGT